MIARRCATLLTLAAVVVVSSAHVGSPDVFFAGKAGPYDIRVVVRPPEVVPGVARVTVRAPDDVHRVTIRPVYWRAGSRGAPSADETRRLEGQAQTFAGSLWLMARGAYTVDVTVDGARGTANVLVPVGAVASGRLEMSVGLGVLLVVLGGVLLGGLVNIVYKSAGEALIAPGLTLDTTSQRRARRVAALALPVLGVAILGGAQWWRAVDQAYERTIYRPSPVALALTDGVLRLEATDTLWQARDRPSGFVRDHGKLMHLFLIRAEDARVFAHLHPQPLDSSPLPPLRTALPPLPDGEYHVFADVVHETGFERTLVGSLSLGPADARAAGARNAPPLDADDAWFVGDASRERALRLADSSIMELQLEPEGIVHAGAEQTIRIVVRDPGGADAQVEPYLGMAAHAVVARVDGAVYVHLHPMGTVSTAAQDAFLARDRGDTTASGALRTASHAMHGAPASRGEPATLPGTIEFPYAFPRSGSYRLFVQVKRHGRILTGAFAIVVAEPSVTSR